MDKFNALVVDNIDGNVVYNIQEVSQDFLSEGDVLIKVAYSSVNYKDMLAVQTNGGVIKNYPMIPGIDLSGVVVESNDPRYSINQKVIVTGFDLGMSHTGGLAQYARVKADWIVPLPGNLSLKQAMIIGTAGFTAAQSINELERNGLDASKDLEILVTGSTGGVGSIALKILSQMNYQNITALVRKDNQVNLAKDLGATKILKADEIEDKRRVLAKEKFHYVLDTVGGQVASALIPQLYYNGCMSMCGNAGGIKLETTVLPFILRGIRLSGIDSVNYPIELRAKIWQRFANEWKIMDQLQVNEYHLDEVDIVIEQLKEGTHLGRSIIVIDDSL